MDIKSPIPNNEFERVLNLTDYDLDYSNFQDKFKDLAKLAARVAGTPIALVNLIDSNTQWTITNFGIDLQEMPREESVCQYLIASEDSVLEVEDLSKDERFFERFYVTGEEQLRYYYGIPLKSDGYNIGTLCVMDREKRTLSPEKEELLKIIADEIVNRLKAYKAIEGLRDKVKEVQETQNKVVHDIRGPLGGIIGLTEIISELGKENKIDEVLEFIKLIHNSGESILELADEILSAEKNKSVAIKSNEMDMQSFKEKLEKLYIPQAKSKNIQFAVNIIPRAMGIPFPKNKLLQITGNLISNAIKFTPNGGRVSVGLDMDISKSKHNLNIKVKDSGKGISKEKIDAILNGCASSEKGTDGEIGYGFGLQLIRHLISGLNGKLNISSRPGEGSVFEVMISGNAS